MKKVLSIVLCLIMVMSVFAVVPISVFAEETDVADVGASSGTTGECKWELDGTELTISGNGEMGSNSWDLPWGKEITKVVIMNGVTSISYHAFYNCSNLESVNIADSVTSIGSESFLGCSSLKSITIPSSVVNIGDRAFHSCTSLVDIFFSNSYIDIGGAVFYNTPWLANQSDGVVYAGKNACYYKGDYPNSITFKDGTLGVSGSIFQNCKNLEVVVLPDSVVGIGDNAFYGCSNLNSIDMPDSLTSIGVSAFSHCNSLRTLDIPATLKSISRMAFWHCSKLNSIVVDESNSVYDSRSNCNCIIETQSNTLIQGCNTSTIPNGIRIINEYSFSGCENLLDVTIPESVEKIGIYAFSDTNINNLYLSSSVTNIDRDAFDMCNVSDSIVVSENNSKFDSRNNCNAIIDSETNSLILGCKKTVIPDTVTSIASRAFYYCSGLNSINIPDSVVSIGEWAFLGCSDLQSVSVPDTITYMGNMVFDGTPWYDSLPDGLIYFGKVAYTYKGKDNCPVSIEIKEGTLQISPNAFESCTYLKEIHCPDSLIRIGSKAFNGCTNLQIITVPDSLERIGGSAFSGTAWYNSQADGIVYAGKVAYSYKGTVPSKVIVADETISLGNNLFYNRNTLEEVYLPKSLKYIGNYVFNGTNGLVSFSDVYYSGTKSDWNKIVVGENNDSLYNATIHYESEPDRKSISSCTISLSSSLYTYDGNAKKPTVTVKDGSKTLSSESDYTVSFSNNINAGTATVTVTGKGDYTGSTNSTFTIKARSIMMTTITLSQSSYTYDGKEKKPGVTVKDGSKTLTSGTDYTVSYKNNVNVGTATVTVTGKGNYTDSDQKTFTIKSEEKNGFTWGTDNWNFNNSAPNYFSYTTYRKQISDDYMKVLKKNLTNSEYQVIFEGSWYSEAWLDDYWGGSCYGMSSTTLLSKNGILPYGNYKSGATKLHDLNMPNDDKKINSLITYYQMLQVKDVIQQQYRTVPYKTNEANIKNIISTLNSNDVALIGFQKSGWGGHAILATGYEYGSWTWNGVAYQGCIKICDPNCSVEYNNRYNIYFNTNSYNWTIPGYTGMTSVSGAKFNYIGADIKEINKGGYLSGTSSTKANNFVARIDATAIADNRAVSKVAQTSNGSYITQNNAPGDIIEDYSYVLGNESEGTIGYNLYDANASYRVTQETAQDLQLSMDYEDCNMSAGSKAGTSVIFDKSGFVQVTGESANYNLSMTFDYDFPTDWFNIEVKGEGANTASLKKVEIGFVLESDSLKNVDIKANNMDDIATISFSTNYGSVLLREINKNKIAVLIDKDNNGTYETDLMTGKLFKLFVIGDTDGDGQITIVDATKVQQWLAKIIKDNELDLEAAKTVDNTVSIVDATRIQQHLARIINLEEA